MKAILAVLLLAGAGLAFVACESDLPPSPEEGPLRRGLTGGGKIVPLHPENDPAVENRDPVVQKEDPILRETSRSAY